MRSYLKVGFVAMLALGAVAACDRDGVRDEDPGFDADRYVDEELRDFFEIEEKAGPARQLPEQAPLLPNVV